MDIRGSLIVRGQIGGDAAVAHTGDRECAQETEEDYPEDIRAMAIWGEQDNRRFLKWTILLLVMCIL